MLRVEQVLVLPVSGKWQQRILQTLYEAREPLTRSQIRIRCGATKRQDPFGAAITSALRSLRRKGYVLSACHGRYLLAPVKV